MEELKKELEKLSKTYLDTPDKEEKVLIPFIKKLLEHPVKERRKLLSTARELQWIKGKFMGYYSETYCDPARRRFLAAVQFVCGNKREMDLGYEIDFNLLCRLLSLYCPDWLTDYVNSTSYWSFNIRYEECMQLIDMGYLKYLTPETVARLFPQCISVKSDDPKQKNSYDSTQLLSRDITLKEHIWYLFEYGMNTWTDTSAKEAYKKGETTTDESISAALYRYSLTGQIDRDRLLKATLSTFQRGFKKDLTGYFADFFEELHPTKEETLSLQEEIMQVFTSAYTKPVNVMLQCLKTVATEKEFRHPEFIDRVTPLFFSSPKNSLLTIYAIFEQIAELHPDSREACCICLSQLFLKKDEALQKKAANFIIRYGEPTSDALQVTLQTYQTEMLQSAQSIFKSFISIEAEESEITSEESPATTCKVQPETVSNIPQRICREGNLIPLPANKEDFLFQLSRFFDMSESWEIDTIIASMIAFHPQLKEEDFSRMDSIFQRTYTTLASSWDTYSNLKATFMQEYEHVWTKSTPQAANSIEKALLKIQKIIKDRSSYDKRFFGKLANWQPAYSKANCFEPMKQIWLEAICKVAQGDSLPLLSTPTHTPCYIQATELVQRLAAYQRADKKPLSWDFQLAILRCAIEDKEETLATARHLLKGEYLNLISFLFDENTLPTPPFKQATVWFVAGLVKAPDTEFEAFKPFKCTTEPRRYLTGDYAWEAPEKKDYNQFLQIDFNKWKEFLEYSSHSLWQEYLDIKSDYNMGDASYMERIFSAFPNLPEPVAAQVISHYMDFEAPQEESKRVITCALRMLLSFHCPLREMSLLLLAGSLLFTDRTVRSYAAELWIEGISSGRVDNQRLGGILARLLNMDIAPLKRFITQAYESMYKRSTFHNCQLEELISTMIAGLPDKPVTGQKQLLELYLELLNMNGSKVKDEKTAERLKVWSTNTNLKKVVATLTRL